MMTKWMLVMALAAASCGADDANDGDGWPFRQPDPVEMNGEDFARQVDECTRDSDCGDERYCAKPDVCGGHRYCEDGYPPISAAPPIAVCSCDGTIRWVNHGYPGPSRWEVGNLAWDVQDGTPCNPDISAPFTFDIELFLPMPEEAADHRVLTRLSASLEVEDRERERPDDGVLSYLATGGPWSTFQVSVLVDRNDDGACDGGDVNLLYHADPAVDLVTFEVRGDLESAGRPGGDDPCVFWPAE